MANKQRISYVIQEVPDEAYLIQHLQALRPTTIGVIDNADLLGKILDAVPGIKVGWLRFYSKSEEKYWSHSKPEEKAEELLRAYFETGLQHRWNTYLYVSNEPVAREGDVRKMADWHADFMRHVGHRARLLVGNLGVAVYKRANIEAGDFDNLFRAFHELGHKDVAGFHEYGPPILPHGAAGRTTDPSYFLDPAKVQPDHWPSPWDAQISTSFPGTPGSLESNYYIGRLWWWDERANHVIGRPLRKVITEAGWDNLDSTGDVTLQQVYRELKKRFGNGSFLEMRGVGAYRAMFEAYYPQWGFENTVLRQLDHLQFMYDDTIHRLPDNPEPTIEGINLFGWTGEENPWFKDWGYIWAVLYQVHRGLEAMTVRIENKSRPEPEEPPVVIPPSEEPVYPDLPLRSDERWRRATITLTEGLTLEVHETPVESSDLAGVAFRDEQFWYIDAPYENWYPVRTDLLIGWVETSEKVTVAPVIEVPPPDGLPIVKVLADTIELRYIDRELDTLTVEVAQKQLMMTRLKARRMELIARGAIVSPVSVN